MTDEELIKQCRRNNSKAQKMLYDRYAPMMRGVCIRYARDKAECKDILQEGFIRVFSKIDKFSGKGSFGGWMRMVMVNTAINYYHKTSKHAHQYNTDDFGNINIADAFDYEKSSLLKDIDKKDINPGYIDMSLIEEADFSENELLQALNILPDAFKIVFNLYFIEDLKHKDIAEMLKIDENTSRSRLLRARNMVKQHLFKMTIEKLGK